VPTFSVRRLKEAFAFASDKRFIETQGVSTP